MNQTIKNSQNTISDLSLPSFFMDYDQTAPSDTHFFEFHDDSHMEQMELFESLILDHSCEDSDFVKNSYERSYDN